MKHLRGPLGPLGYLDNLFAFAYPPFRLDCFVAAGKFLQSIANSYVGNMPQQLLIFNDFHDNFLPSYLIQNFSIENNDFTNCTQRLPKRTGW
ncbi:hypothetical protein C0081_16715 [Cohaesibacter celericrescens]|uniref:Uncharacterized protein n=1 Tax=Cohaesibacter celericrescens TaxID=2067669 RepID=A0A2N5XNB7_9HYPH|nr:hypothetical protein C0081_16715 [Cohaesibacter celericrescens]